MDHRYEQLAGKIGLGQSQRIARIFAMLADETQADLMLAMPGQAPDLAKKLDLDQDLVEEKIQDLFIKGAVLPYFKLDPPSWRLPRDLIQFHDTSILWPDCSPAYLDLWKEFMDEEWYELAAMFGKALDKPHTRIIPVNVSIKSKTQILDFESVEEIISNAYNITVTKCTCRASMRKCDHTLEACIQVNKGADYNETRGSGRKITAEEAMDIIKKAEEEGLIHVTMNKSQTDNYICNCCPCCCLAMPVLIEGGVKVVDPSRFRAEVDPDECSGCGMCHERCYFSAITWTDGEGSPSVVNADKCMGCGLCLVTCPEDAIEFLEAREPSFVPGAA